MTALRGIGVSPGVGAGPVVHLVLPVGQPVEGPTVADGDVDHQCRRLEGAAEAVARELMRRADHSDEEVAEVLQATALMAQDPALLAQAQQAVRDRRVGAVRAAWEAGTAYASALAAAGGYLGERERDVRDVRDRWVAELSGAPAPGLPDLGHPYVLVADDLSPADTATLLPNQVMALVTAQGGPTGHTAIIARSIGIPAVVACAAAHGLDPGETVVVDGDAGTVERGVDPERVAQVRAEGTRRSRAPRALPAGPHGTADGTQVVLLANVGDARGAERAVDLGVGGCGLFRTELLFLDRLHAPTRQEQARAYEQVLEPFGAGRVVVRTLDAGADKPLPFLSLAAEPNPALGVRGLRVAAGRAQVLDDQLGAIADAAARTSAEVWVMAPMVSTVEEASWFRERCHAAGLERVGVMIEVPAAALTAAPVLAEVDFASIGTNDLAQYAMAADRCAGSLAALNDPWQPAVLRLIEMAGAGARSSATPLGVCGEAAGDPLLACVLVGLGVRSLSADAQRLADVADALARVDLDGCVAAAAAACAATSPTRAREVAGEVLAPHADLDDPLAPEHGRPA